ncbi:MAG TPA: phage tail sheath C-terminal domain-containing protein [Bryobacteraceae bacterium]|jgi:phage tail sheath protein FI|nr:phage tail sheath C-terminal domain-containing protein [Bryobacteraceae bacterium]
MPTYTYPGVYIQEVDTGNKPIEGVSTSIAGFLGIAERGPVIATFIASFADYQRSFGSYSNEPISNTQAYLAYAVEGFFLNGGQECYVARVASSTALFASVALANITIQAAGPGTTGNNIGYWIQPAGIAPSDPTMFRLTILYYSSAAVAAAAVAAKTDTSTASQVEVFDNLSINPQSSSYFAGAVNSGSNLVTVTATGAGNVAQTAGIALLGGAGGKAGTDVALVLGDFQGSTTDPANPTGLAALNAIDNISIYCCPDEHFLDNAAPPAPGAIAGLLQAQCELQLDRFAILQSAPNAGVPAKVVPSQNSQRGYSAFYYPWLNVANPKTDVITLIPPGGHLAGIYARSDSNYNVAKDPANEPISGIQSLQLPIDNNTQGILNPIGVNCLRFFKGQGNLVWGGRTTSPDPDWQYISVRRLFIYVEKSIQQGTQWVVFEPNSQPTWARLIRSVSDFLTGLWMQDMLQGATKDQAFFVRCDTTTMTQTDIDSGRLIAVIGIAPVKPAEFVIFQIGQYTGGSTVTES